MSTTQMDDGRIEVTIDKNMLNKAWEVYRQLADFEEGAEVLSVLSLVMARIVLEATDEPDKLAEEVCGNFKLMLDVLKRAPRHRQ